MKIQFHLIRVVSFLLITSSVRAQNAYQPNKIIPPSPTAASLGKFGDIPVGYYTGTPDISVPLYEIKTRDFTVPISMSYDATGIRVTQDASWVGLGWSLSAGGLITRVVRGKDDLSPNGYYNSEKLPLDLTQECEYEKYLRSGAISIEQFLQLCPGNTNLALDKQYGLDVFNGVKDGEPDIFSYNFGGYSGKFLLDKLINGAKIFDSKQNVLDIKTDYFGDRFIITTPDGNQYYFGTKEVVTNLSTTNYAGDAAPDPSTFSGVNLFTLASGAANSSWYLDKMTSASGDTIKFIYEQGQSLGLISNSSTHYYRLNGYGSFFQGDYKYNDYTRQKVEDVLLKRIEFAGGRVEFETSSRDDIEAYTSSILPQKLSGIKIYNNSQTAPLKVITFGHSYFETFDPYGSKYYEKRLKLDYLEVGEEGNKYSFSYYNPNGMPSKYSRQVDEWGFYTSNFDNPFRYTGNFNYPDLYPRVEVSQGLVIDGVPQERSDSTGEYLKTGVLKSIIYPTKGKTEFEYEPHSFSNGTALNNRMTQIAILDFTDPDPNNQISTPEDAFETITLTKGTSVTFNAVTTSSPQTSNGGVVHIGYLRNSNGDLLYTFVPSSIPNGPIWSTTYTVYLAAGQYTLEAKEISGQLTRIEAVYDVMTVAQEKGCGLRIKSTTNYDADNTIIGKKTFDYSLAGSSTTSGLLLKRARNFYLRDVEQGDPGNFSSASYLVRSSSSLFPEGFYSRPNVVGYSRVSVKDGINGNNGTTVYNYYNQEIIAEPNAVIFPGSPEVFDTRNGQLLSVEVLDSQGDRVQRTGYDYTLKAIDTLKGLQIFRPPFYYDNGFPGHDVNYYNNYSEWWVQSKKRETSYVNNGTDSVSVVQTDKYDNPLHKQITSTELTASDNIKKIIQYKYPHDFISQQPYATMVARNIISPVIEKSTYKDNTSTLLEVTKTNYDFWMNGAWSSNTAAPIIVPHTVQGQKLPAAAEIRLRYHSYDDMGNVRSLSQEDGSKTTYLWGYRNQYPIAEIKNADYSQIEAIKGSSAIRNFAALPNPSETDIDNFLAPLRNGLSGAMITSYTYQPLVGITTMTDPRGQKTKYVYDNFQRMVEVRDHNNNIIKKYDYHIKP